MLAIHLAALTAFLSFPFFGSTFSSPLPLPEPELSLVKRQILPPASTHPLKFVPGAFTRDGAAAACGPGMVLAAVDAYNWGQATSMTGGMGAWIRSWNTDSYGGTCIALYSSNSINVPPQGCAQLLAALCEPGTPAPPATPPPAPAPPAPPAKAKPPAKKPAPAKKPPPKKGKFVVPDAAVGSDGT